MSAATLEKVSRLFLPISVLSIAAVCLAGCGEPKSKPVTAESSQYEVADEPSGNDDAKPSPQPKDAAAPATKDRPQATGGDKASGGAKISQPPVTPPLGAAANQPDYTVPDDKEAILAFLERLARQQPQGMEDFQQIQQARIEAAEKLWDLADDSDTRVAAAQTKLDAYRMLSQVGVPDVDQQLVAYSTELRKSDDPQVAMMAKVMLFGLAVDGLASGEVDDAQPILDEMKNLIAHNNEDVGLFRVASQAAVVMQQLDYDEEALQAYRLIATAFKDHEDDEVVSEVQSLMEREKLLEVDFEGKLQAMMLDGTEQDMQVVLDTLSSFFTSETPSEPLLDVLSQTAQLLEMTGRYDAAKKVFEMMEQKYKDHENPELAETALDMAENGRRRVGLVGEPFEIQGVKVDGSPFDWNQYKGKIVLVDFWATWCVPCLQEIPNIAANYEKYRDQGFEVVGVNLDDDPQMVNRFFSLQPLPWPTVISPNPDERGMQNPLAEKCGIDAIPFVILVGRDGKVIDLHVRGERLGQKLSELLGPPAAKTDTEAEAPQSNPADGEKEEPASEKPAGGAAEPETTDQPDDQTEQPAASDES